MEVHDDRSHTHHNTALLTLFEHLKVSLRVEADAPTEGALERAHDGVRQIEIAICDTPAEGLVGIAIKLAIWKHINCHHHVAADQAESAYQDLCRMGDDRDHAVELDEAAAPRRAA